MAHNDSIDTRYRSRSPADRSKRAMPSSHRRSQSPHAHPHHSHHKRKRSPSARSTVLPFSAPRLSKGDFPMYEPMFALYLDIQKKLLLEELPATEAKGRWKSFVGKWYVLHFPRMTLKTFALRTVHSHFNACLVGYYANRCEESWRTS